jgi:quinol-cytochrome oxidoreductase complex cytochrome b subunit
MSFWAATVITNLITSVPVIGAKLIIFVHGAFSVQGATLNRFFVLHYLLAIIVLVIIILHVSSLHAAGSTNPSSKIIGVEKTHFFYYFVYKDIFLFFAACLVLCFVVFLKPNVFNHPDNFIEANALVTPTHIVPE